MKRYMVSSMLRGAVECNETGQFVEYADAVAEIDALKQSNRALEDRCVKYGRALLLEEDRANLLGAEIARLRACLPLARFGHFALKWAWVVGSTEREYMEYHAPKYGVDPAKINSSDFFGFLEGRPAALVEIPEDSL